MKYFIFREGKILTGWGFEEKDKTSSSRWLAFGSEERAGAFFEEIARHFLDEVGLPTVVTIQPFDQLFQ